MSWANDCIPVWTILMPYEQWEKGKITDDQMWEWLNDKKNNVPKLVIENWRRILNKEIA